MDTYVPLWDDDTNTIIMPYLYSLFLSEPSAQDIFEKYESPCVSLIQNCCDGPHVNLKFLGILEEKRKELELTKLIFIGTCGLHTLHNSFERGETASEWRIKNVLSSMDRIFDESPSRRADIEKLTDSVSSDYPLKVCAHRWVEKESVAKRVSRSG